MGQAAAAAPAFLAAAQAAAPYVKKAMDGEVPLPAVGRTTKLRNRIGQAERTATDRAERQELSEVETDQARGWARRAKALADRLAIPVAKDKKKAHLDAIEADLDALNDEMNAALLDGGETAGL